MARIHNRDRFAFSDLLAAAGGAVLGLALGLVVGGSLGRVNSRRIKRAAMRWAGRGARSRIWTGEEAERLEARVLDALARDVVLARRPIRVQVLGQGLVELTGHVLHVPEIGLAGDLVQNVEGVETVLNHLLVQGSDAGVGVRGGGPSAPRAARG